MAKLCDVAKEAGVSVTLASFVMNGRAEEMRIAPATVQKVLEAAKNLSYLPNMAAKRLITSERTPSVPEISFLWPPTLHPTLLGNFVMVAQSLFRSNAVPEMNLTICPLDAEYQAKLSANYFEGNFNGVIISPMKKQDIAFVEKLNTIIPVIVLHARVNNHPNIVVDHYAAGEMAARALAGRGHRNVMLVSPESVDALSEMNRQQAGFLDTAEAENLQVAYSVMPNDLSASTAARSNFGRALARELYDSGRLPEAIYIRDDIAALGFISALWTLGVRVPESLEVITYGGSEISEACSPSLTTVDYPTVEFTRTVLTKMNELLYDTSLQPETVLVRPTMTFRESCPE